MKNKNKNKDKDKYAFSSCLKNVVLIGVITSVIGAFISSQFSKYIIVMIISSITTGIFILLNLFRMLKFRLHVKGVKAFYLNNILSTAIYCGTGVVYSVILHFVNSPNGILSVIYARIFFNFKFFHFLSFDGNNAFLVGTAVSALLFSVVCLLIVLIFPLVINRNVKKKLIRKKEHSNLNIKNL